MSYTVLLVEDDFFCSESLDDYLKGKGFLVIPYEKGYDALQHILGREKYDIGIVDLSLPGIDGFEVIRASKKTNPNIPIISLSGAVERTDSAGYIRVNRADYRLQKPMGLDHLYDLILRLLCPTKSLRR